VPRADDAAIARLAARQHGNVTRAQLLRLDVSANAIAHRARSGRLHRVFTGVYAVGRPPTTPLERAAAAVLAGGPGAVLSHGAAASLWGLHKRWRTPLEVIATSARRHPGIVVHRSSTLGPEDATRHFGIPVTSPARTIFDVAPGLSDRALARAVNDARLAGHLWLADLDALMVRFPWHPTTKRLKRFTDAGEKPTRSEFEDAFKAFAVRYALPRPLINHDVNGREVDVLFPHQGLIVELDGYEYHGDRASFERDRDHDAEALQAGLRTVRLTWERFEGQPAKEARRLKAILRRSRAR
jgi:Transcriptional regulator, AbiEi antitoxin